VEIKHNENCQGGCNLIATRILKISEEKKLYFYNENILCEKISEQTEKNWSFFKYNDEIFFSYGLTPKHIIYSAFILDYEMKCGELQYKDNNYYGNYEKHVNSKYKNLLKVSVSTPSIQYLKFPERYIGVGHTKFKYKNIKLSGCEELKEFYINTKRSIKKKHYTYVYLMFLYEFDPKNGKLARISNMFIPESSEYLLVFPTGLIYIKDELWIFYGNHDSYCNIMIIKKEYIEKILKPIPKDKNSLKCDQVDYFIFPQKCYRKSDICKLLLD
jgi:hypothetical protein